MEQSAKGISKFRDIKTSNMWQKSQTYKIHKGKLIQQNGAMKSQPHANK